MSSSTFSSLYNSSNLYFLNLNWILNLGILVMIDMIVERPSWILLLSLIKSNNLYLLFEDSSLISLILIKGVLSELRFGQKVKIWPNLTLLDNSYLYWSSDYLIDSFLRSLIISGFHLKSSFSNSLMILLLRVGTIMCSSLRGLSLKQ